MATSNSVITQAFVERKPVPQIKAQMSGAGLYRSGNVSRGGFSPAMGALLAPALTELGKVAIPDLYSGIKSGISKVGKWFKGLFGRGVMRGGMRARKYGHPDASYHQMGLYKGPQLAEDFIPYMANEQYRKKDIKRLNRIRGGFATTDIPRIMELIKVDDVFAKKLNRAGKKGDKVKFLNRIYRGLNKKKV